MKEPMFVLGQYTNTSRTNLAAMKKYQKLLYGLIVASRFSPFYSLFSRNNSFGEPRLLEEIREIVKRSILDPSIDYAIVHELIRRVDALIPDSNIFPDCSDAMDAGLIHLYILEYLAQGDSEKIVHVSNIVYDLLDRKAQDALQIDGVKSPTETQIDNHSIIKNNIEQEYQIQEEVLNAANSPAQIEIILSKLNVAFIDIEQNAEI